MRVRAADIAEERETSRLGRGVGDGEGDAEDRVGPEVLLVGRAVESLHLGVDEPLLARIEADEARVDLLDDGIDRLPYALAEVAALVAVASLGGLEGAGRGAGRHGRPRERAVVETDLDLDGGVAARVQDLAGANLLNGGHCCSCGRSNRSGAYVPSVARCPAPLDDRPGMRAAPSQRDPLPSDA